MGKMNAGLKAFLAKKKGKVTPKGKMSKKGGKMKGGY